MKFQVGDRFKVKDEFSELGMTGLISGTSFNSIYQRDEYVVRWDNSPLSENTYSTDECDRMWDHECPVVGFRASQGIDFIPMSITIGGIDYTKEQIMCNAYNHDWVEVGFHFTKTVCKRCDVEKSKT